MGFIVPISLLASMIETSAVFGPRLRMTRIIRFDDIDTTFRDQPDFTVVRDDLGISRAAMGFALGAWALIYIVSAPPAGRVIWA